MSATIILRSRRSTLNISSRGAWKLCRCSGLLDDILAKGCKDGKALIRLCPNADPCPARALGNVGIRAHDICISPCVYV